MVITTLTKHAEWQVNFNNYTHSGVKSQGVVITMIENEEWRDIEGYDGYYQVSNFGRVRSLKFDKTKILKNSSNNDNYLQINLSRNGNQKRFLVHRLVASAFIANPDNKPEINHINGVKTDNRVENLEWATATENQKHAFETGLQHTKLTKEQVAWIRNNYKPCDRNFGGAALARKFNVTQNAISTIVRGKHYANAGGAIAEPLEKRKLTDDEVRFIRENYKPRDSEFGGAALARKFNVTQQTISNIIHGKRYRDVQ